MVFRLLRVGPIGVLGIRRTLAGGCTFGFVSGLGAATADAVYGCIAGFGLTVISDLLVSQQLWFRIAGGAFLCYLGFKTFMSEPAEKAASAMGSSLLSAYGSTFFLTLTNPMTIISFAAVFAGLGLAGTNGNYVPAGVLVMGVFTGSTLWWFILSGSTGILRARFNHNGLQWINRISGAVITVFGLLALSSLLK